jgi:ubiquinone/menaquinone biosynthesis C-methylase UbiE
VGESDLEAPTGADDFDSVAWCYDWTPIPTHPRRLHPHLQSLKGPIIDLGGGTGKYTTRMLAAEDQHAIIVDPSRKMLAKGYAKGRRASYIQAMGQRLPFGDESITAAISTEAFHHLGQDQDLVLKEVSRVLREDGAFFIEEPDPSRFIGRIMAWGEKVQGMNSVFWTPSQLAKLLEQHFEKVVTTRTGWFTYLAIARVPRPHSR